VHGQSGIEIVPDLFDRGQQLRQPLEREELALERHEHGMRGGHCVHGEKIEGGRAIDENIAKALVPQNLVLLFREHIERFLEAKGAIRARRDFEFETHEIERRRRDEEAGNPGFPENGSEAPLSAQDIIGGNFAAGAVDSKAGRGIALRIEIDDEHPFSDRGERGSEINRGRGFANPAFLIGKHEYAHGGGGHLVLHKKAYVLVFPTRTGIPKKSFQAIPERFPILWTP
jgi:hypothetical protein